MCARILFGILNLLTIQSVFGSTKKEMTCNDYVTFRTHSVNKVVYQQKFFLAEIII